MLSRITGQHVRTEARSVTTSFDIIKHIKTMRIKWLGNILRDENAQDRLVYSALQMHTYPGGLLSDAPPHTNLQHLRELAMDKAFWNEHIKFL